MIVYPQKDKKDCFRNDRPDEVMFFLTDRIANDTRNYSVIHVNQS